MAFDIFIHFILLKIILLLSWYGFALISSIPLWFLDFLCWLLSSTFSLNFRDQFSKIVFLIFHSTHSIGLAAFNMPINPTYLSLKQTPSPLFSFYFNFRLVYPSVSLRHPQRWIRKMLNVYPQMNGWYSFISVFFFSHFHLSRWLPARQDQNLGVILPHSQHINSITWLDKLHF